MNLFITGASSGIAASVIQKIPAEHQIYVSVHTEKQLELIQKRYQNVSNIQCLKMDTTNPNDIKKLESLDIDIFISNAAIGYGGSVLEIPVSLLRKNYETNVFSNIESIQVVLKNMIQKKHGRIIVISSLASYLPIPFLGSYASSKASLNHLIATLRLEMNLLDVSIPIITILPGLYRTGFNQVMTEEKFDRMDIDTYFTKQLEWLKKYETPIYHLLETKNLDTISNTIIKACFCPNPKRIYRTRKTQAIFAKLYQFLFE